MVADGGAVGLLPGCPRCPLYLSSAAAGHLAARTRCPKSRNDRGGASLAWHASPRYYRKTITPTPSYCDISLRTTLSPGCRPLLISIRFTEVAPNCTTTRFAEWPSGSSLKSVTLLFDGANTGLPTYTTFVSPPTVIVPSTGSCRLMPGGRPPSITTSTVIVPFGTPGCTTATLPP